jgi:hypothetical protein
MFQNDCALRDIQLVGQKTTQSGVSFPFHRRRPQFDLNRVAMFARDLVDLPVWDNVKTQCRHRRIVAQFAIRAVAFRIRMIGALLLDKHPNVRQIACMKPRHLYVVFCLLGLVLPYSQFIPWIIEHHALNISMFMHDLFANRIAAFFALDVIVSAIVLLSLIQNEGRRLRMRFLWLPMLGTVFVGVSLGLRLSLYLPQVELDRKAI